MGLFPIGSVLFTGHIPSGVILFKKAYEFKVMFEVFRTEEAQEVQVL
jgi:hypothetical protein